MLLVYLVGVVLSLVQLKRLAKPAAFALVGCGMLFLITAVFPFVQGYVFVSRFDRMWTDREVSLYMGVVGIVRTLLHLTAFSLILAAIFTGRRVPVGSGYGADAVPEAAHESARQPHRATLVIVLGILSLIVCAPLGIMAWVMGGNDLAAMRSGRMDRSGESLTSVGQVLGIIGTVLFGLGIVGAVIWFLAVGAMLQSVR
jgi:hypothetical protein